jgi:hypothetical protein
VVGVKEQRLQLKLLQKQLPEFEAETKRAQVSVSAKQKQLQKVRTEILNLQAELSSSSPDIGVSDHAVLRYLEKKFNLDIKSIRDEILTPMVRDCIKAGAISVNTCGMKFKVSDKTITTVI